MRVRRKRVLVGRRMNYNLQNVSSVGVGIAAGVGAVYELVLSRWVAETKAIVRDRALGRRGLRRRRPQTPVAAHALTARSRTTVGAAPPSAENPSCRVGDGLADDGTSPHRALAVTD